jgi:hypothetical protein
MILFSFDFLPLKKLKARRPSIPVDPALFCFERGIDPIEIG